MASELSDEQEARKPQSHKRKKKRLRKDNIINQKVLFEFNMGMLVNYCLNQVRWEDARPVVEVIERQALLTPSPILSDAISQIKQHFDHKIYGRPIRANNVNVIKPTVNGSFNKFCGNRNVNIGKE